MISTVHRFQGLGSLRYVFNRGKTVRSGHCSLRYNPNPKRKTYRLAVVVSKKVHKNAVIRNRIRRRIYEIVRKNENLINESYDLVISVYSDQLADMEASEVEATIINLFQKADITKSK